MKKLHILLAICASVSATSVFCMEESVAVRNLEPASQQVATQKTQEKKPEPTPIIATLLQLMTPSDNKKNVFNSEQMAQLLKD